MFSIRTAAAPLALACALALVAPSFPLAAADGVAPPRGVNAGPCVEGICEYTLGNGLRSGASRRGFERARPRCWPQPWV